MIVENPSNSANSLKHDYLAHAQTIVNHFLEALELNDCNVKIAIGFYQELQDTIDTINDLTEAFKPTIELTDPWRPKRFDPTVSPTINPTVPFIMTEAGVQASIQALKEKCFNCKLRMPKIKFDADFKFNYDKLSFQLEVYKLNFKKEQLFRKPDFCHVAFAFQKACIPDILKLIALLLQAAAAILALNKLPRISLGVFIKAIVGKLMASVVASLNISIDMSSTGLPCILSALEEIALALPTKENIANLKEMTPELKQGLMSEYQTISSYNTMLEESYRKGEISEEELIRKKADYRKRQDPVRHYADKLKQSTDKLEDRVNDSFKVVSDTVKKAQDEVNGYIESVLGLINFFECENSRSGPDFSEIISWIRQLNDVINLISSILAVYLRKVFSPLLCQSGVNRKELVNKLLDKDSKPPLTRADLIDVIKEFTGKEAKINDNGTAALIYDKPYKRLLPKLELLGCNLQDFANAHTIDNLIKTVVEENSNNPITDSEEDKPPRKDTVITLNKGTPPIKDVITPGSWYQPVDVPLPRFTKKVYEKIPTPLLDEYRDKLGKRPGGIISVLPNPDSIRDKVKNKTPKIPNTNDQSSYNPWNESKTPRPSNTRTPVVGLVTSTVHPKDPTNIIVTVPINVGNSKDDPLIDEINSIIDFIYTPPPKSNPKGFEPLSEDSILNFNLGAEEDSGSLDKRIKNTPTQECRTFEDVLDKLNSLRI